jgi:uncharacterized protein with NRDE domain
VCTIAVALGVHPGLPLLIAANRDELYARPARPPELLDRAGGVVGGVDAESGGTWFAVRRDGAFAAVTNQRAATPRVPGARSRGEVVRALLLVPDPLAYVRALDPGAYNSMNLVFGDAGAAHVAYLRHDTRTCEVAALPPGLHVLCNDRLGAPGFPRGARVEAAIAAALADHQQASEAALWPALAAALADHQQPAEDDADVAVEAPLVPAALARAVRATCIHGPGYGTRSASLVALAAGRVVRYLHAEGPPCQAPFHPVAVPS